MTVELIYTCDHPPCNSTTTDMKADNWSYLTRLNPDKTFHFCSITCLFIYFDGKEWKVPTT